MTLREYKSFEVVYFVDSGQGYKEEVTLGSTALLPESFIPTKEGYEFVGWREDTVASNDIVTEKTVGTEPITLYAVFRKLVTLTYNGNGSTSGDTYTSTGYMYYNNGNTLAASITLLENRFTKTNYKFKQWSLGSADGTIYQVGDTISLTGDNNIYAKWTVIKQTGTYTTYGTAKTHVTKTVTFPEAFETTPTVTFTYTNTNSKWSITLKSTTKTNFTIDVYLNKSENDYTYTYWTAVVD